MKKLIITGTAILTLFSSVTFAAERLSLGYIYNASKSHSEIIATTNNSINVVSPTCFDLKTNGRLEINDILDEQFIKDMHAQGIKVTPFLSNHWGRKRAQAALKNPMPLIEELVAAINKYNFDGVNVDLENLLPKDKDNLTNFMKFLRKALPREKTLSIAVAANPNKLTSTWIVAYDYKALAEYVDYMVVMTYDEHSYGGGEGPVAGIEFVEKSLQVVLEEVSKDKVVMGIPLYGRFWEQGEDVGGEAIVMGQMPNIINQYKLVPKYDVTTETPHVTLKVKEGQRGPYVNGRYLDAGTYNIWYENENSIKAKLELVNKYDILGAGLWALDNENVEFWNYYKSALNATPYESEEEIKIRKKLEFAYKYIVDDTIELIKLVPEDKVNKIEANKIEFVSKENLINKKNNTIKPSIQKIKHFKTKRCIVKINKTLKSMREKIQNKITWNIGNRKKAYSTGIATLNYRAQYI